MIMIRLVPCPACLRPNYLEAGALALHAALLHRPQSQDRSMDQLDLAPLFTTPQIVTDDQGRHWDPDGIEQRSELAEGEVQFVPASTPLSDSTSSSYGF